MRIVRPMSQHTVTIEVASRRLKIACPAGQESALLQAADEVTKRLTSFEQKNHTNKTPEQAMLMTALNLANDLLQTQKGLARERIEMQSKIDLLQSTIEQALLERKSTA
jgi:cell division protein ZapA